MFDYAKNYQHIDVKISPDGVALVGLNRPPHNLINRKMHTEITTIPRDLNHDEDVRAIVFHAGEARNFAAGGDSSLFDDNKDDPVKAALGSPTEAREFIWNMIELEKPAAAAVKGLATGMGCMLALYCDIVFAADDEKTRFTDGHANIGLAAGDGGSLIFPMLIGLARAKQHLFTAEPIYAKEAERIGLISKAVPPDQLLATATEWATRMAALPTLSVRWTKSATHQWLRMAAVNVFQYSWALQTLTKEKPEFKERMDAMKAKTLPKLEK
jgi:enoyl-CoA hydratase